MIAEVELRGEGFVVVEVTALVLSCDHEECSFYEVVLGTGPDDLEALRDKATENGWAVTGALPEDFKQDLCPGCRRDVPGSSLDDA